MAFAAATGTPQAAAETLSALLDCPKDGPYRACVLNGVIAYAAPSDLEETKDPTTSFARIAGRLNDGPQQTYRLRILRYGASESAPPQSVAYLGQSSRNRPVVLTDRGPLEIFSKGYAASGQPLVDERRWKFSATELLFSASGETVVTSPTDIGVWDEHRQLCVSGLIERGRLLHVIENGCRARRNAPPEIDSPEYWAARKAAAEGALRKMTRHAAAWYAAQVTGLSADQIVDINTPHVPEPVVESPLGNVEAAAVPLERIQKLFPHDIGEEMHGIASQFGSMGNGIFIERIKGSHLLIVTIVHDDC